MAYKLLRLLSVLLAIGVAMAQISSNTSVVSMLGMIPQCSVSLYLHPRYVSHADQTLHAGTMRYDNAVRRWRLSNDHRSSLSGLRMHQHHDAIPFIRLRATFLRFRGANR